MRLIVIAWLFLAPPALGGENAPELGLAAGIGAISYGNTLVFGTILMASQASDAPGRHPVGHYAPLYLPVVGPFIAMGSLDAKAGDRRLLVADGILQTTAACLLTVGVVRGSNSQRAFRLGVAPNHMLRFSTEF